MPTTKYAQRLLSKKGFTLVELLVVVAIIAILSVIGLTIFTSAQANARDARRKADVDAIAKALEAARAPGSVKYETGPRNNQFSGGAVPSDSNRYYCIATSTGSVPVTWVVPGTAWTTACPTVTDGVTPYGSSAAANATYNQVTDTTSSGWLTNVTGWNVCASLESSSNPVYCKPSSQ